MLFGDALMKPSGKPDQIHDDDLKTLISDCVDLLLPTLPPEQAKIVHAIEVDGMPLQSVADMLGLSLNQATTLFVLGWQSLKDRFATMHTICPKHGMAGCDCHLRGTPNT